MNRTDKMLLNTKQGHISFGRWLRGFLTIKVSSSSKHELKLVPRWVILGILAGGYAVKYIGTESVYLVFMEFVVIFLLGGIIWYIFNRLMGKTKI